MKFYFGSFVFLACLITSCEPNDPVGKQSDADCNLIKLANSNGEYVEFTIAEDILTQSTSYNQFGELDTKKVVTYDAKGNPTRIDEYGKEGDLKSYWNLTVDDKGRIISANSYIKDKYSGQYVSFLRNSYEFNDKGQISKYIPDPDTYVRYVYDSNGNMIQYYIKLGANPQEYLGYEAAYDTKLTPTNRNQVYRYLLSYVFFNENVSNNPIRERYYYSSGEVSKKYSYSYQYNEKGVPTERIQTDSTSSVVKTQRTTFNYNCK